MEPFIKAVSEEYEKYQPQILQDIWAEQYAVWKAILRDHGDNGHVLPHTQITKKAHRGENSIDRTINIHAYN
jgi:hypothetical protein